MSNKNKEKTILMEQNNVIRRAMLEDGMGLVHRHPQLVKDTKNTNFCVLHYKDESNKD